ncbi:MAG: site-specific integrase [Akkermansiaceae bacterium]|nr:site-specific integrase [Akkermansiaceae bacterium]
MATLYKRPGGETWIAKFKTSDGIRTSRDTGCSGKREAQRIAAGFETEERDSARKASTLPRAFARIIETAAREAAAGELTLSRAEELVTRLHRLSNPNFRVVSLANHLENWIQQQKPNVSVSTAGVYADMKRHVTNALGPKTSAAAVGDLTTIQIQKALAKLKESGLKGSTVNMVLAALRRALHTAVTAGLANANAATGIKPLPQDDSTERAPFTAEEVRRMIDHPQTSTEWQGAILVAAHTGLRLGDVVSLSREHIDGTKIVIRPQKTKRSKKTITVPLTPPCLAWIAGKQGHLFPVLSKRVPGTLSTTFTRIMKSAGVPRDVVLPGGIKARRSFHSLRHTFASWLAEADVHADVRQKLTGHGSSKIHAKYTHHDEALDRAISVLPDLGMPLETGFGSGH